MQSPSCGNKKVPLRGHQERQLQTLTSLGMASSRLWRAALVLTPLLHSTHLVRLTFQALGGPQGSTAAPSMEVQEGSTGHHQSLQPSYSHGQSLTQKQRWPQEVNDESSSVLSILVL